MEITGVELDWDDTESEPPVSPRSQASPAYLLARRFTFGLIKPLSSPDTDYEVNPITLLKLHQVAILICSILLMIILLQIPTILYYTNCPTVSGISSFANSLDIDVNFTDCSVSYIMSLHVHVYQGMHHVCLSYTYSENCIKI